MVTLYNTKMDDLIMKIQQGLGWSGLGVVLPLAVGMLPADPNGILTQTHSYPMMLKPSLGDPEAYMPCLSSKNIVDLSSVS